MSNISNRYPNPLGLASFAASMVAIIYLSYAELARMVDNWLTRGEYGHGILIPFIFLYMLWERRDHMLRETLGVGTLGVWISLVGCLSLVLGEYSAISALSQFAVILIFTGGACAILGTRAFKKVFLAFLVLFFMIPLPAVIFYGLSNNLQLISSELSVVFIRLIGMPVFLEGNIIDLGVAKLEVVEACNGLRYLLPLLCLSIISIYYYRGRWWEKTFIILVSVPLAVLLNSFRIAATAFIVRNWGVEASEGFAHDFEGWLVFLLGAAILGGLIWIMSRFGKEARAARAEVVEETASPGSWKGKAYWISLCLIVLTLPLILFAQHRPGPALDRKEFSEFPKQIGDWREVTSSRLSSQIYEALGVSDYLLGSYVNPAGKRLEVYAAYYEDQKKGKSVHSPKACLPGAGWKIVESSEVPIILPGPAKRQVFVNRDVVQKGSLKNLVYYWFKQRERYVTDEYLLKAYLFYDSIVRNRTDGALVRVIYTASSGDSIADADEMVKRFIAESASVFSEYIPD